LAEAEYGIRYPILKADVGIYEYMISKNMNIPHRAMKHNVLIPFFSRHDGGRVEPRKRAIPSGVALAQDKTHRASRPLNPSLIPL
jgi:hypothetical protein